MSSGIKIDFSAFKNIVGNYIGSGPVHEPAETAEKMQRLGMSPRQIMLNRAWAVYRCESYGSYKIDWDGGQVVDTMEAEAIASGAYIPPGFYDSGSLLPLRFRRPTAPYAMAKVIVDRFTSMLFGERRHPHIRCDDDMDTEDYLNALCESSRLWSTMILARTLGGAMGSVAIGFQFMDGKPVLEVHDPRWTTPTFKDRHSLELKRIEKLYQYPVEIRDPETGLWHEMPHWYRRVITEEKDILYKPVPVTEERPYFEVEREVEHGFGFCPVVWIQNTPMIDSTDGDPDCHGAFEMIQTIDMLLAQANRGTIANADPTLVISTDAELPPDLQKGSRAPIKLPANSKAEYLELKGAGSRAATELADMFRRRVLEVCQCVIEDETATNKERTATEVERTYAAMMARADILREQYGERGIKPLLLMMLAAIRRLSEGRVDEEGRLVRGVIAVPPKVTRDPSGRVLERRARVPGEGQFLHLSWPGYFEPTLADAKMAVDAAAMAVSSKLVDQVHAATMLAPFFRIEDVRLMLDRMQQSEHDAQAKLDAMAMGIGGPVVEEGLNGSQVKALQELVQAVNRGELDREAAIELVTISYPIARERAEGMFP